MSESERLTVCTIAEVEALRRVTMNVGKSEGTHRNGHRLERLKRLVGRSLSVERRCKITLAGQSQKQFECVVCGRECPDASSRDWLVLCIGVDAKVSIELQVCGCGLCRQQKSSVYSVDVNRSGDGYLRTLGTSLYGCTSIECGDGDGVNWLC